MEIKIHNHVYRKFGQSLIVRYEGNRNFFQKSIEITSKTDNSTKIRGRVFRSNPTKDLFVK